jgi:hypothetical protein
MSRATRLLCLLHFAGNALLLWLGYYWLGLAESSIPALAWSALVALVVVCVLLWLHAASCAHFRIGGGNLKSALKTGLRSLPALAVLGLAVIGIYFLLTSWQAYSSRPAFKIASYITFKLRKPVNPTTVLSVFNAILWLVRWTALPALLLPLAAEVAGHGWRGFLGNSWKVSRRRLYWLETPLLLLCSLWLPFKLILWVPRMNGFGMEMTSFLTRLALAYLLFTGGWLLLEFFSSGGIPRSSQPKTVTLP